MKKILFTLMLMLFILPLSADNHPDVFELSREGALEELKAIVNANPELANVENYKGYSPLILAVYHHHISVVDFLIEMNAEVDHQDASGNSALMGAIFKGYDEMVGKLLKAGADPNLQNYNGATALTFAATFGQGEMIKALLQAGANPKMRDATGKTALDYALIQDNQEAVQLLRNWQ